MVSGIFKATVSQIFMAIGCYWILSSKTVYATVSHIRNNTVASMEMIHTKSNKGPFLEASNVSSVKKSQAKVCAPPGSVDIYRLCALTISCLTMGIGVQQGAFRCYQATAFP